VVAGNVGAAGRRSFAAIGDTTNLAARLMSAAQPGQVVIGATTQAQLEGLPAVELTSLGPIRVKGKRQSIDAWALSRAAR
jgi:class 3 adenylate cyclase